MSNTGQRKPLRISVEEARERSSRTDNVIILDVVDPGDHEQLTQQIAGAVRIDPRTIDDEVVERLPKSHTILTYCT